MNLKSLNYEDLPKEHIMVSGRPIFDGPTEINQVWSEEQSGTWALHAFPYLYRRFGSPALDSASEKHLGHYYIVDSDQSVGVCIDIGSSRLSISISLIVYGEKRMLLRNETDRNKTMEGVIIAFNSILEDLERPMLIRDRGISIFGVLEDSEVDFDRLIRCSF